MPYLLRQRGYNGRVRRPNPPRFNPRNLLRYAPYAGAVASSAWSAYKGAKHAIGVVKDVKKVYRSITGPKDIVHKGAKTPTKSVVSNKKARGGPKISKSFKAKVNKVIAEAPSTGRFIERYDGALPRIPAANTQWVDDKLYTAGRTAQLTSSAVPCDNLMVFFSHSRVNHMASVLFNGKVRTLNYGLTTNNLSTSGLKVHVKYQSATVNFRNQSNVAYEILFYQCISKAGTDKTALEEWISENAGSSSNVSSATIIAYGNAPSLIEAWAARWKYTCTKIMLAPGQVSSVYVKGPSMTYDYQKFIGPAGTLLNFPKGVGVNCFYTMRLPEVALSSSTAIHGHPVRSVASGYGVVCDVKLSAVIEAPEICADAQKYDKFSIGYSSDDSPWSAAEVIARIDPVEPSYRLTDAYI